MVNQRKLIVFSGGGTIGSVAPLLAVASELRAREKVLAAQGLALDCLWVGTKTGPERELVETAGIRFAAIPAGKWRRYYSWRNLLDLVLIKAGFFMSLWLMIMEKPAVVLTAGSFVSVPLVWAAWVMRVPVFAHQQDVRPSLANRLIAPFARLVTVSFEASRPAFGRKARLIGNFIRREFGEVKITAREARQKLGLSGVTPVVLVMGGGTGAQGINDLLAAALPALTAFCQVLHVTGQGKLTAALSAAQQANPNYRVFEFLDTFGMIKAYAAADAVVSRAGMSSLTELSFLGKAAILIPMPDSHQEENAAVFAQRVAAIVLDQQTTTADELVAHIRELLTNENLRRQLTVNIRDVIPAGGEKEVGDMVIETLNSKF